MNTISKLFGIMEKEIEEMPFVSIYDYYINDINGNPIQLSKFKGKKILIVNVASNCGFTKQYSELQSLYEIFKDQLEVIAVPSNQFGGQEPGSNSEIRDYCETKFGVTFPITEKVYVRGENQHPIYDWLTNKSLNGRFNSQVKWNFQKYLIDENGNLMNTFSTLVTPLNNKIIDKL